MTRRVLFACVGAGSILLACGPRPRAAESASSPPAVSGESTPLASSLDVKVNREVRLAFHVTNTSGKKMELVFPSGQTHEFVILDSLGRELWRWSEGRMFTQAIQTKLLGNGETLSYEEQWDGALPKGTLTAVATLRSERHPLQQRVDFIVR